MICLAMVFLILRQYRTLLYSLRNQCQSCGHYTIMRCMPCAVLARAMCFPRACACIAHSLVLCIHERCMNALGLDGCNHNNYYFSLQSKHIPISYHAALHHCHSLHLGYSSLKKYECEGIGMATVL